MEEHVDNVQDFQAMMSAHADWINGAEQTLAASKHPSKLVEPVLQQISEHKVGYFSQFYCTFFIISLISLQAPRSTRSSSVVTLSRPPTISLKITDR